MSTNNLRIPDCFLYKSTDVALYLLAKANGHDQKISMNMTKLQKLLYVVYGVYLFVYKERLLDEHPQAWPYGPVFPSTRNRLLKEDFSTISIDDIKDTNLKSDTKLQEVILFVFTNFGSWNAGQLSEWSHIDGSPWEQTTKQEHFKWGNIIDDQLIMNYFSSIIKTEESSNE